MVLAGGEDYVLLFTLPPAKEKELQREGIQYHIIGSITGGAAGVTVLDKGTPIHLKTPGYDHFK